MGADGGGDGLRWCVGVGCDRGEEGGGGEGGGGGRGGGDKKAGARISASPFPSPLPAFPPSPPHLPLASASRLGGAKLRAREKDR